MRYSRETVLGNLYRRAKGVLIGKASSRVLTFSVGFCPGSQFAYIVFITSCTVHSLWIYNTFFQNFGQWESSSNGLKEWTKCGRKHEPKKLKLSSFSPACWTTSGLCLTCVPVSQSDLSCKFQRSSLLGGLPGGSMLCFIGWRHVYIDTHFWKGGKKTVNFFGGQKLEVCYYTSYLMMLSSLFQGLE